MRIARTGSRCWGTCHKAAVITPAPSIAILHVRSVDKAEGLRRSSAYIIIEHLINLPLAIHAEGQIIQSRLLGQLGTYGGVRFPMPTGFQKKLQMD